MFIYSMGSESLLIGDFLVWSYCKTIVVCIIKKISYTWAKLYHEQLWWGSKSFSSDSMQGWVVILLTDDDQVPGANLAYMLVSAKWLKATSLETPLLAVIFAWLGRSHRCSSVTLVQWLKLAVFLCFDHWSYLGTTCWGP